jgi:hypothetical protein
VSLVSYRDAGTQIDPLRPGRRDIPRLPITQQALADSIDHRTSCNEWCVLDYDVIGIFIEPPIQYTEGDQLKDIEVPDVFSHFPNLSVYAFHNRALRKLDCSGNLGQSVSISELYPAPTSDP